jgi:hypothetical protein
MNLLSTIVGSGLTLQDNYQDVRDYISRNANAEGWVLVTHEIDSFGYELDYVNARQGIGIIFVDGMAFKIYPLQLEEM